MSKYFVIVSGSNEIINTIEWDGISAINSGSFYTLQQVTSSLFTSSVATSSFLKQEIDYKPSKLGYGVLAYGSGSNMSTCPPFGNFILNANSNATSINLSLYNLSFYDQDYYSGSISRIINENIKNYILTLKQQNLLSVREYLVTNTEISSSNNKEYLKLSVNELVSYTDGYFYSASSIQYSKLYSSSWNVDFNLDQSYAGKFFGSVSGSFTGSLQGTASHALNFTGVANSALTAISSSYATFAETASKLEIFTTSSNWTKPSWAKTVKVVCVGGGGGGGGSFGVPSGQVTGGGGGAGGSVSIGEFDANLLPSSSISITVGAGGTGGAGQDSPGASGGSSMFDTLLIARGGEGGQGGTDMGGSLAYVRGGRSGGTINYLNTGGGPGGRGSVSANGITDLYNQIPMTLAPSLPLNEIYVDLNWNFLGYPGERMGIPAAIAPTGGGGGLGYDADNGGNQGGETTGGSIKTDTTLQNEYEYFSTGLVGKEYTYSVDGYVPAFYTKIGLGGNGGNPSASIAPSDGSRYGGGGGGAYGFYTGSYGPVSSGARGADGVVIIISEA